MTEWQPDFAEEDFLVTNLRNSILEDPFFKSCITGNSKTLVLRGKPGVGKTFLAQSLVHYLRNECGIQVAVAFFHHDTFKTHKMNAAKILAILLKQLVKSNDEEQPWLTRLYRSLRQLTQTRSDIAAALREAIHETHAACIVIDALDECVDPIELNALLGDLRNIQNQTKIGLVLTERLGQVASHEFYEVDEATKVQEVQARDDDIEAYIRTRINNHAPWILSIKNEDLAAKVQSIVVNAARGMCVSQILRMAGACANRYSASSL